MMHNWHVRPETNDQGIINQVYRDNACKLPVDMTGQLFVDVGAHIGAASVLAAERGAHVLAYEPCRANFDLLVMNVLHLAVEPRCLGIGKRGSAKLYLDPYNTGQNSEFLNLYPELSSDIWEWMRMIPLAEALGGRRCDFLKIDCEGGETAIVDEIVNGLHARIDYIYIEADVPGQLEKLEPFYNVLVKDYGTLFRRK